jgi:molybdenum ABC transporter molybdate-binding protein
LARPVNGCACRGPRAGLVVRPWLVVLGSVAAVVLLVGLLWLSTGGATSRGKPAELVLFCAAGLAKPVEEICTRYEQEYGTRVIINPAGSGTLLSQLRLTPERVDLFLAAEESFIDDARRKGLIAEVLPVIRQQVTLAVSPGSRRKVSGWQDLLRDDVRLVVPNPELAAVGRAAKRALEPGGHWAALLSRRQRPGAQLSLVGTVTEAAQAVKIGAADAAVVWDVTARQFGLETVAVPELQARGPDQALLGVVAACSRPTAALHFARYLTARDRGQLAFQQNYFQPLEDADAWADRPSLVLMAGAMLKPGIDDLVKSFSEREGVTITTIYNGCGVLVAQMKTMKAAAGQPAPAQFPDAYFSCDVSFMDQVRQWFEASTLISRNDMVLVVPKGNPKQVRSIEDLARPELRVGLAHPVNSALGALTDDLLKKLKLHERVYDPARKCPVMHADAGHALVNQMRVGALDLLVVYRSNVLSNPENAEKHLQIVEMNLPEAMARQPFAVAKDSQHKYLMRRLLAAILSPESKQHFIKSGFQWIAGEKEGKGIRD